MSGQDQQFSAEYYDQVRQQIEHEDDLITQRLSWLMASQSFLFSAYAIILNGLQPKPGAPTALEISKLDFCHFVVVAGILSTSLIYASICGGMLEISHLKKLWLAHQSPDALLRRPPIQSSGLSFILGQSAPRFLPAILIVLWLYLLLLNGVKI
ncbi:MAG: hypothetical protein WCD79_07435 [Chthoniobacteraceae bacterium]